MALTKIILRGRIAKHFGKEFELDVVSPSECVLALTCVLPGFETYMRNAESQGLTFAVFAGGLNVSEAKLANPTGRSTIVIEALPIGSKKGGLLQTILGAVLIVASIFIPPVGLIAGATLAGLAFSVGVSLAIGGVMQMLTPQPKGLNPVESAENKPNYAFGPPVNTNVQGNPVPVLLGDREIGGAVISAGVYVV